MTFLISFFLTILLIFIGRNFIKNHSNLCYVIATLMSLILIIVTYTNSMPNVPNWINNYVLAILTKGSFSTAIFVVVMYTGALKNGSKLIKILMPIRAELSIIASILTLGHNIIYGKTYFLKLFTNPQSIKGNMLAAAIVSIILILIMVPLMITSFPNIRKKMKAKKWKQLQRLAYIFYGLIYVHLMLIMIPIAKSGVNEYRFNVILYSLIFLIYGVMRIRKFLLRKAFSKKVAFISPTIVSTIIFLIVCTSIFNNSQKNTTETSSNSNVLEDGVYTGSGSGFNGDIKVEVSIENGSITNIELLDYSDDKPFINNAFQGISTNIINAQSTDIDTVSGATYSSQGIIEAVKNAINN